MTCKWYSICPLRRFEEKGILDKSWAENYCQSIDNWRNCKRYQLEEKGLYHPDNMLPNGDIDESISVPVKEER
jgi:hypothetical protein